MSKKVLISAFPKGTPMATVLLGHGTILDNVTMSAETEESLISGNYLFDGTFFIDDLTIEHIEEEAILKVRVENSYEIFRIATLKKSGSKFVVMARQITMSESTQIWLDDVRPENLNGSAALRWMLDRGISKGQKEMTVTSDISNRGTAYYVNKTLYEAIHSADNCFLKVWGGEVKRRGYNLNIMARVGVDRNISIRRGVNLKSIEASTNIDNVITRIKPKGYNGITIDGFVDSPLINNYSGIYTKEVKYDDVKVKGENTDENDDAFDTLAEAQAELIKRAKLEFSKNHVDELRADYSIKAECLDSSYRYDIGDTVKVYEDKLGIDVRVRVVARKFNVLRQELKEIELSNIPLEEKKAANITQILKDLANNIAQSEDNTVQQYIQSMINAGNKDSYVIYGNGEISIYDNKDPNLATNVIKINKNGFGFSQDGGVTFTYGMTIDGKINADLIKTGALIADFIKGGKLAPLHGKWSIDLDENEGFIFYDDTGKRSYQIENNATKYYTDNATNDVVGHITSTLMNNATIKGLTMANLQNSYQSISYKPNSGNYYYAYALFDKYGVHPNTPYNGSTVIPISWWQDMCMLGNNLWFGADSNKSRIYRSDSGRLAIIAPTGFVLGTSPTDYILTVPADNSCIQMHKPLVQLTSSASVMTLALDEDVVQHSSDIINYYTQSLQPILSDIGEAEIGKDGEVIIGVNMEMLQQIESYQVFTTCYGEGSITSIERDIIEFKVKGTPGLKFGYEIKGKKVNPIGL